jgi:phage terminase large subunit-like protein
MSLLHGENMRLAISRAVAVETPRGWRIAKEKQSHKIDVVVALAMAAHAAIRAQSESKWDPTLSWVDGTADAASERAEWRRIRLQNYIRSGGLYLY